MSEIKNYIKNFMWPDKSTNKYWRNITFPKWYKYVLLIILQIFIVFGLIIIFQILFPETIFITKFITYVLIFLIFIWILAIGTLIYILYSVMNNAIKDYKKSIGQNLSLYENGEITPANRKILNELIETKRNLIFTKGMVGILIMAFFIIILNENLQILLIGIPLIIFFLLIDILQYKKYLNIREKTVIQQTS